MSISLYNATIGCYLQTIPPILGCLDKARAFCIKRGMDCEKLLESRLHASMLPLHFQIITMLHFSEGAIIGAKTGKLGGPDMTLSFTFDQLQTHLCASLKRIGEFDPADIEGLCGGEVVFQYHDVTLPFLTEDFFQSYATPNFYFHTTTAYAILRAFGVPVGIADYIGTVRTTHCSKLAADVKQQTGEEYLAILEKLAD